MYRNLMWMGLLRDYLKVSKLREEKVEEGWIVYRKRGDRCVQHQHHYHHYRHHKLS
jgi:hypothetical protein